MRRTVKQRGRRILYFAAASAVLTAAKVSRSPPVMATATGRKDGAFAVHGAVFWTNCGGRKGVQGSLASERSLVKAESVLCLLEICDPPSVLQSIIGFRPVD